MTTLAGTWSMARLVLRRNRVWLAVWLTALVALPVLGVPSLDALHPTQADIDTYARTAGSSPAAMAMNGPGHALHTLGGITVFEMGGYLAIAVALMNVFAVGRNTRAEEEVGRVELIRSNAVGRHATLAGCLLVVFAADVVLGAAVAAGMVAFGLPSAGSAVFGASLTAIGVVFAALTALTAQVSEYARGAYAIAGAVVGASYVVRAAGDTGDGTLSWLSPIGWAQATRPFADSRWWPLLISAGAAILLVSAAVVVESRRDHGAGVVRPRPGPETASRGLLNQVGFALRLQRGGLIGWGIGVFLGGLAFGSVARETQDMMAKNPGLREFFDPSGRLGPTDLFLGMVLLMLAMAVAGYVVASTLRLRAEEYAGHAEPLLAGALSRRRWTLCRLAVPAAATVALLALAGLGLGIAHAVLTNDPMEVPRLVGAAVAHTPAVWLLAGIAVLLFGVAPRAAPLVWPVLAGSVVASLLGSVFRFPGWFVDLSPFERTPQLPGDDLTATPLVVMAVIGIALTAVGIAGFRRRDLATSG